MKRSCLILIVYPIFFLFSSCSNHSRLIKYKNQVNTVDTLLNFFAKNDSLSIKKMIGVELSEIGLDDGNVAFGTNKMHEYLKEYKRLSTKYYKFEEYSPDEASWVDITIPFENINSERKKIFLIVYFVKYIELGKILNFRVIDTDAAKAAIGIED